MPAGPPPAMQHLVEEGAATRASVAPPARIGSEHQRVVVAVLLVEPVTPPVASEPVVPEGELVPPDMELDPELPEPEPLPLVPGPPIELVLPLVPGVDPLLLLVLSVLLLPLVLGLVPAVLDPLPEPVPLVDGGVVLEELVEPVAPVEPVVASRLLQALSERAATTARVAAAH